MGEEKSKDFFLFMQKFSVLQKKKLFLEAEVFLNSLRACMHHFIVFPGVPLGVAVVGCDHIEMEIRIRSYSDFWSLTTGPFKRLMCVHHSPGVLHPLP